MQQYDENLILDYIEDELPADQRAGFEQLLAEDAQLRKAVEMLIADRRMLRDLPCAQAPADMMDNVNRRLERHMLLEDSEPAILATVGERQTRYGRWLTYSGVAAVLAISALLMINVLGPGFSPIENGNGGGGGGGGGGGSTIGPEVAINDGNEFKAASPDDAFHNFKDHVASKSGDGGSGAGLPRPTVAKGGDPLHGIEPAPADAARIAEGGVDSDAPLADLDDRLDRELRLLTAARPEATTETFGQMLELDEDGDFQVAKLARAETNAFSRRRIDPVAGKDAEGAPGPAAGTDALGKATADREPDRLAFHDPRGSANDFAGAGGNRKDADTADAFEAKDLGDIATKTAGKHGDWRRTNVSSPDAERFKRLALAAEAANVIEINDGQLVLSNLAVGNTAVPQVDVETDDIDFTIENLKTWAITNDASLVTVSLNGAAPANHRFADLEDDTDEAADRLERQLGAVGANANASAKLTEEKDEPSVAEDEIAPGTGINRRLDEAAGNLSRRQSGDALDSEAEKKNGDASNGEKAKEHPKPEAAPESEAGAPNPEPVAPWTPTPNRTTDGDDRRSENEQVTDDDPAEESPDQSKRKDDAVADLAATVPPTAPGLGQQDPAVQFDTDESAPDEPQRNDDEVVIMLRIRGDQVPQLIEYLNHNRAAHEQRQRANLMPAEQRSADAPVYRSNDFLNGRLAPTDRRGGGFAGRALQTRDATRNRVAGIAEEIEEAGKQNEQAVEADPYGSVAGGEAPERGPAEKQENNAPVEPRNANHQQGQGQSGGGANSGLEGERRRTDGADNGQAAQQAQGQTQTANTHDPGDDRTQQRQRSVPANDQAQQQFQQRDGHAATPYPYQPNFGLLLETQIPLADNAPLYGDDQTILIPVRIVRPNTPQPAAEPATESARETDAGEITESEADTESKDDADGEEANDDDETIIIEPVEDAADSESTELEDSSDTDE